MIFQIMTRREQDLGRGLTLIAGSAVVMLLTLVLPPVVPLAVGAYGIYRAISKQYPEAAVAVGIGVGLWFLRGAVSWMLWGTGALMAGVGIFFIIRGLRDRDVINID